MTMLAKRSAHDEMRREGEARTKRRQEIVKEISGWKHRLETAEKRIAELSERRAESEAELKDAQGPRPPKSPPSAPNWPMRSTQPRRAAAPPPTGWPRRKPPCATQPAAEREAERLAGEAREARARAEARADAARETVTYAPEPHRRRRPRRPRAPAGHSLAATPTRCPQPKRWTPM